MRITFAPENKTTHLKRHKYQMNHDAKLKEYANRIRSK